jgi:hypothetical protein
MSRSFVVPFAVDGIARSRVGFVDEPAGPPAGAVGHRVGSTALWIAHGARR